MNAEETKEVLNALKVNYPQSFRNWNSSQMTAYFNLWYDAFKDTPAEVVGMAVKEIIYKDNREFAPNIGQVNAKIRDLKTIATGRLSEDDAWAMIVEYIHKYGDDYQEYKKLPEEIQRTVTHSEIKEWGMADSETFNSVLKPQFKKAYARNIDRKEYIESLSPVAIDLLMRAFGGNSQIEEKKIVKEIE